MVRAGVSRTGAQLFQRSERPRAESHTAASEPCTGAVAPTAEGLEGEPPTSAGSFSEASGFSESGEKRKMQEKAR